MSRRKKEWGSQLARLCCGELAGTYHNEPKAEYRDDSHAMRFDGGAGAESIDFVLPEDEPADLHQHAKDLVDRYGTHLQQQEPPKRRDR